MRKARRWYGILLAGVMALGLTGCSPDSSSAGNTQEDVPTVSIQLKWIPQAQFMGFYVAEQKGYYEEAGINVNIIPGGSDITPANQVASGAAEFATSNYYSMLQYNDQGYTFTNIFQMWQRSTFRLISFKERNIQSVSDLAGKNVGVWTNGANVLVYAMLNKNGLDWQTDVNCVKQAYTMDDFLNGTFDAASAHIYGDYLTVLESGVTEDQLNVIDPNEENCAMLEDCIICDTDWLEDNRETAQKFIEATYKGWRYACENPEEAGRITFENYCDPTTTTLEHQIAMAEQVAATVAPNGAYDRIGFIDDDLISLTDEMAFSYGLVENEVTGSTYDDSLWNAIEK